MKNFRLALFLSTFFTIALINGDEAYLTDLSSFVVDSTPKSLHQPGTKHRSKSSLQEELAQNTTSCIKRANQTSMLLGELNLIISRTESGLLNLATDLFEGKTNKMAKAQIAKLNHLVQQSEKRMDLLKSTLTKLTPSKKHFLPN